VIYSILGYLLISIGLLQFILAGWNLSQGKKIKSLSWNVACVLFLTGAYAFFAGVTYLRAGAGLDFSFYYRMCWIGFAAIPFTIDMLLDLNKSHAKWKRYITRSLYAIWGYLIYLCATTNLIEIAPDVLIPYTEVVAPYETAARTFAGLQILFIIYEATRARIIAKGLNRSRVGYLALGLSLYASMALFASVLMQTIAASTFDPALTSLFSILFAVPVAYATTRQRLFDLRILILRLLLGLLSTIVFFLIHFITFTTFSGHSSTDLTALVLAAIVVSIIAFLTPLYGWLSSALSFAIRGKRIPHGQLLGSFNNLIVNSPNLDEVLRKTGHSLQSGLGVSSYAILLADDQSFKVRIFERIGEKGLISRSIKNPEINSSQILFLKKRDQEVIVREEMYIETNESDIKTPESEIFSALDVTSIFEVVVPLISKGELLGLMCLGPRLDASAYTTEDVRLVSTLGTQLALYIENARLFTEAVEDGLTGLFHQKYFKARLSSEVSRLKRHRSPMALLLLDIDHFKSINDTHGHVIGDHVLADMGSILRSSFRTEDVVARYGGEEFAVLLIEPELSQILPIAERVRKSIENHHFSDKFKVTVSIGVYISAQADIQANLPISDLVDKADQALYKAKRAGRNRVVLYEDISTPKF
jgi:diguanylate cyclase (GGDEF)-like protein